MSNVVKFPVMPKLIPSENLPNRLRWWRLRRGLTQAELAPRLNISPGHLANLERGDRELTVPVLDRLAKELQCTVADLLLTSQGGLTEDERRLIETYREVPEGSRNAIAAVAESQQAFRGAPEVVPLHDPPKRNHG